MQFQKREPTLEEKKALKGRTNVEALLYALDQRMMGKTPVVLVGRASYEIGNEELTAKLRQALGEDPKIDERTGRVLLTDDIDCYLTDEAQAIVDAGHPDSYVAKLADCYVHALNERTLILPKGWDHRVQNIPGQYENLELKRLDPLDFVICKGAAGRLKDIEFLRAFCNATDIRQSAVEAKIQETTANAPLQLRFDAVSQRHLRSLAGKLFPPPRIEIG